MAGIHDFGQKKPAATGSATTAAAPTMVVGAPPAVTSAGAPTSYVAAPAIAQQQQQQAQQVPMAATGVKQFEQQSITSKTVTQQQQGSLNEPIMQEPR